MKTILGNRPRAPIALGLGFFLFASANAAEPALKDLMRFKLHYAQGVLEGIATENFPLVETNANRLIQLARSGEWKVRPTPEYERFTTDFIRSAEALDKAAKKASADAASVAYFRLTVSCVNCHRHLRGVEAVRLDPKPDSHAATDLASVRRR